MDYLPEFIHYRTYARYIHGEGRRETVVEAVDRLMAFVESRGKWIPKEDLAILRRMELTRSAMASRRLAQTAGLAVSEENACAYNCSYRELDSIEAFAEGMYLLMCGTGFGFSVESDAVSELPKVQRQKNSFVQKILIDDSRQGWAKAFLTALQLWFGGYDCEFDFSRIRPAGAPLMTMGGRASGPGPLKSVLDYARFLILSHQGKRLSALAAHDLMCKVAECVIAGGVRRSAQISLSDLDDYSLRDCKAGSFYIEHPHRSYANISAVYYDRPSVDVFLTEWLQLIKNGTGERGIFNRLAVRRRAPKRRNKKKIHGTNPCGEIALRSRQFCNLSEVVVRPDDTLESLKKKIRYAVLWGVFQSTLTDFEFISPEWKENCEEERLLGVSLTGQASNSLCYDPSVMVALREEATKWAEHYAILAGINMPAAVTCVKPSGTLSLLAGCSAGLHPWFSKYFVRRVRIDAHDPLFHLCRDQGVPFFPEVGQDFDTASVFVLEFPVAAPKHAVTADDVTALDQLKHWLNLAQFYTDHNPSATIYVRPDEWLTVGSWVYDNFNHIGGITFIQKDGHAYLLPPYSAITEEEYERRLKAMPAKIDYSKLPDYEKEDRTMLHREFSCSAGSCELL